MRNICRNGSRCQYFHPNGNNRKGVCRFFNTENGRRNRNCTFIHIRKVNKLCRDYQSNNCQYGQYCRFSHKKDSSKYQKDQTKQENNNEGNKEKNNETETRNDQIEKNIRALQVQMTDIGERMRYIAMSQQQATIYQNLAPRHNQMIPPNMATNVATPMYYPVPNATYEQGNQNFQMLPGNTTYI